MDQFLEALEPRIAPATTLTFTDVDGDLVTIKSNVHNDAALQAILTFNVAGDVPKQLQKIDFSANPIFAGSDLTITAKRTASAGNGFVNVGYIDATALDGGTAIDLGKVRIDGDLGRLEVGDSDTATIALKSLNVQSIGNLAATTQAGGGNNDFSINGTVGTISVKGDIRETEMNIAGNGTFVTAVNSFFVGGSILGRNADDTAKISINGNVGNVKILGDIVGGTVGDSGQFNASIVNSFFLGGSLRGGVQSQSGTVNILSAGKVFIGGDIVGGDDSFTGTFIVNVGGSISNVLLKGSLIGGLGDNSGRISAQAIGTAKILGDIRGGDGVNSGQFGSTTSIDSLSLGGSLLGGTGVDSGFVQTTSLGKTFIGGDIRAGNDAGATSSARIEADSIALLTVRGSLVGGDADSSGTISLGDNSGPTFIRGDVRGGDGIGSGSIFGANAENVGAITVGGSVIGGLGDFSGQISQIGGNSVKILGSVVGGDGTASGRIASGVAAGLSGIFVGGSVKGGGGNSSGGVTTVGTPQFLTILGDLEGGLGQFSGSAGGGYQTVKINGSILGGDGSDSGVLSTSSGGFGSVFVGQNIMGGASARSGTILTTFTTNPFSIGSLTIKGSLIGGSVVDSGQIITDGAISKAFIGGNIEGGSGANSGFFSPGDGCVSLTVGGSLIGGTAVESGSIITNGDMDFVKIEGSIFGGTFLDSGRFETGNNCTSFILGGSIVGGSGGRSGSVELNQLRASVSIAGSVIGGSASDSGSLFASFSDPSKIFIGGDVKGGSASGTTALVRSGFVSLDTVTSFTLNGSIIAGVDQTSGTFLNNGAVRFEETVDTFVVKGSLTGNSTNSVLVTATGDSSPGADSAPVFGSISIGGSVEFARILGGYNETGTGINGNGGENADAQIGKVTVGGDWVASSLVAGADDNSNGFGDSNDDPLAGVGVTDSVDILSQITNILIKGQVVGTVAAGDNFGFVAQQIGSFTAGPTKFALLMGPLNDSLQVGFPTDARVFEIALTP